MLKLMIMEKNNGKERKTNRFHRGQIIRAAIAEALDIVAPREVKPPVDTQDLYIGIGSIAVEDVRGLYKDE